MIHACNQWTEVWIRGNDSDALLLLPPVSSLSHAMRWLCVHSEDRGRIGNWGLQIVEQLRWGMNDLTKLDRGNPKNGQDLILETAPGRFCRVFPQNLFSVIMFPIKMAFGVVQKYLWTKPNWLCRGSGWSAPFRSWALLPGKAGNIDPRLTGGNHDLRHGCPLNAVSWGLLGENVGNHGLKSLLPLLTAKINLLAELPSLKGCWGLKANCQPQLANQLVLTQFLSHVPFAVVGLRPAKVEFTGEKSYKSSTKKWEYVFSAG